MMPLAPSVLLVARMLRMGERSTPLGSVGSFLSLVEGLPLVMDALSGRKK